MYFSSKRHNINTLQDLPIVSLIRINLKWRQFSSVIPPKKASKRVLKRHVSVSFTLVWLHKGCSENYKEF